MKATFSLYLSVCLLAFLGHSAAAASRDGGHYLEQAERCIAELKDDSAAIYQALALEAYRHTDSLAAWINVHKTLGKQYRTRDSLARQEEALRIMLSAEEGRLWRQPATADEWDALAWLYVNIAFSYNYFLVEISQAAAYYEKAKRIFSDKMGLEDYYVVRYVYRPLSNVYTRLGDNKAAKVLLQKAHRYYMEEERYELAAEANSDLAVVYQGEEEYTRAIELYQQSLDYRGLSPKTVALLKGNLGKAYFEKGDHAEALRSMDASLNLFRVLMKNSEERFLREWFAVFLVVKTNIQIATGDYSLAERSVREAEDTLLAIEGLGQKRNLGKLYLVEGELFSEKGDFPASIRAYHKALGVMLEDFQPKGWQANPLPAAFYAENTIMEALAGKAAALKQWYDAEGGSNKLEVAMRCHELSFEVEQLLRRTLHYESSRLFNVEWARRRAGQAIAIALQLWEQSGREKYKEAALAFAERSKSTLLLEAFYKTRAESIAGIPRAKLQEEKNLQEEISTMEEQLFEARAGGAEAPAIQELEAELLSLKQAYTGWIERAEKDFPRYYQLKYDVKTLSVADIRDRLLDSGESAFIEYFVGQEKIYAFVITGSRFEAIPIEKDFPLEEWVVQLRQDIAHFQFSSYDRTALCASYSQLAYQLYDRLLAPLEALGLPEQLTLAPSGILAFLPFDALLTAPISSCHFQAYPYLLRRYTISYAYSATLQAALLGRPATNRRFAGFAPVFDGSRGFGQLNNNLALLKAVHAQTGGALYPDTAATIRQLKAIAASYGLLHFSSHAEANTAEGGFSFIVFSDGEGGYDSLFVKDVYLLPLHAEMAVLSACETSVGTLYQGEGIINLARGFLYAGANSVITTLWSINDDANRQLMENFYGFLREGHSKSEALRLAKLQQVESGSRLLAHPVYWAAFTPVGNMRPVYGNNAWKWWLIGLGALALLGLVARRTFG